MALRFCDHCILSSCLDVPKFGSCDREYCFDAGPDQSQVNGNLDLRPPRTPLPGYASGVPSEFGEAVHGNSGAAASQEKSVAPEGSSSTIYKDPRRSAPAEERTLVFQDLAASIDRSEEEIVVLTTLKDTAEACLQAVLERSAVSSDSAADEEDVPAVDSELVVRVYEALAGDAGPTEGLDVRIQLQYAGKESATSLRPSRSWASDTGTLATRMGALHVTWNELFRFKAREGAAISDPGSLALSVVREDGETVSLVEVPLQSLLDQKVQHQWCTIGGGWRVYIAMQLVRSAADMLHSHIAEFEARLSSAHTKLAWLLNEKGELPAEHDAHSATM